MNQINHLSLQKSNTQRENMDKKIFGRSDRN